MPHGPSFQTTSSSECSSRPRCRRRQRIGCGCHWLLLALTLVTTTFAGGCHYLSFKRRHRCRLRCTARAARSQARAMIGETLLVDQPMLLSARPLVQPDHPRHPRLLTRWATTSCALRYGVDATRPYFLPAPLPLTGTLGAFIRIRSRIPHEGRAVRHRHRRSARRLRRRGAGAFHRLALSRVDAAAGRILATLMRTRRAAAVPLRVVAGLGHGRRTAIRSTCTRWRLRPGSACWRPRSISFPIAQLDGGHISLRGARAALDGGDAW